MCPQRLLKNSAGNLACAFLLFVTLSSRGPAAFSQCVCPADMNTDVKGDGKDIQCFVNCLRSGAGGPCPSCACADMNSDSLVDVNDIPQFVNIVLTGLVCTTTTVCYEPGPLETPPASPCAESKTCGGRPDMGSADSVYFFSGEFHHTAVDLRIKGRGLDFVWARKYRSKCGPNTAQGNQWDFSYNIYIETIGNDRLLYDGNARQDLYKLQPNGNWARDEFFRELRLNGDATYTLTFADTGRWVFRPIDGSNRSGRIQDIYDRNGNVLRFSYNVGTGRLQTITDSLNRSIQVAYNADGLISTVTDFDNREVVYTYYTNAEVGGSDRDLKSMRSPLVPAGSTPNGNDFPSGKTTTYTYSENLLHPSLNSNLLTIRDPKNQVWLANTYDPTTNAGDLNFDRLTRQVWGNVNDIIDVVYVPLVAGPANNNAVIKAIVNDRGTSTPPSTTPIGSNVKEFFYDSLNRLVMTHEYTGRAAPNVPTTDSTNRPTGKLRPMDPNRFETRWTHNADAMPTQITYPNLNTTLNTYELTVNPAAPRRSRGNLLQTQRNAGPLGGDQAMIVESFTYETGFGGCGCGTNFVSLHQDANGFITMHSYDLFGNRTRTTHRPGGGVEDRNYNLFGQVTSHTHPANGAGRRVDVHDYYGIGDGAQNGYMKSATIDDAVLKLKTTYTYDTRGNVAATISPRGNATPPLAGQDTIYTYNALDQLVREQSRAVSGVRYETLNWYDANDNVVRVDRHNIDHTGAVQANSHLTTISEYEILNRLTRTCSESGAAALTNAQVSCADMPAGQKITTEYSFDPNRNRTQVRNPQVFAAVNPQPNDTMDTEYDERDLVFKTIRSKADPALKRTSQTDYDGNGNGKISKSAQEDGFSRVTTNTYDGHNRLKSTTDPIGNVTTHTYDARGNRVMTEVNGQRGAPAGFGLLHQASFTFDAMNRQTVSSVQHFEVQTGAPIDDGASVTTTDFASTSQVIRVTDDRGNLTATEYDSANRRSAVADAKGNTVLYTYDENSNVISTLEVEEPDIGGSPQFFTTTYAYDGLDRRVSAMDNNGNTVMQSYDSRDNVPLAVDALGFKTVMSYDGLDRPTSSVLDLNGNGQFGDATDIRIGDAWDANSQPTGKTDGNGNTTAETYNARSEPMTTDFADCTLGSRLHDVHGNLVQSTDANGTIVNYVYDLLNRLTQKTIAPGPGISSDTTFEGFAYDGLGRIVLADDNDSVVTRTYDSLGNVLTETQEALGIGAPQIVTSTYDGMGNKLTLDFGGRLVTMTYDALNRLKTVADNLIGPIATYNYVGPARVQQRVYDSTGAVCDYEYDAARRIIRTHHYNGGGDIDDRAYTWDANYNKKSREDIRLAGVGYKHLYTYDRADRLRNSIIQNRVDGSLARATNYILDRVGNRTNVSGPNTLDPGPYGMTQSCDPADREMNQYTSTPFGTRLYDENGNLRQGGGGIPLQQFTVMYDYADRMVTYMPVSGTPTFYRYDALGRRIARCMAPDCSDAATLERFIYDGWREVRTIDGLDADLASFIYGNYIDEVLTLHDGVGQDYYYHADDLYNVMAVTNSFDSSVIRYEYDDYGRPLDPGTLSPSTPSSTNPWLFNGRRYDPETGWYYYRTRYLDPRAGRFTTRDGAGPWFDDNNRGSALAFVGNNPLAWTDPFGLEAKRFVVSFVDDEETAVAAGYHSRRRGVTQFILPGSVREYTYNPRWNGWSSSLWDYEDKDLKPLAVDQMVNSILGSLGRGDCIQSIEVTGHGEPGKWWGRLEVADAARFKKLGQLKGRFCQDVKVGLTMRMCLTAQGNNGENFLEELSSTLGVQVRGWTDIYEILGTGWQVTADASKAKGNRIRSSNTGEVPVLLPAKNMGLAALTDRKIRTLVAETTARRLAKLALDLGDIDD